ncbi:hypothetical protein BSPLISOX_1822 [uncultured Gammaproteobacteria bacterium]|nr:hypothetical protein [uncultured Gammaproteobacteria bacterium]CAC9434401.1 hypothetical protein [uncultured Gammaproteobacteria bacterium]CAC9476124.1 hypothetical protein [uncultured Gammaproteobacteria bacterium]VVH66706.1 hypothetical protein BSPLISOX_1822 [uncultured Gammaproteobacteria bacterium]
MEKFNFYPIGDLFKLCPSGLRLGGLLGVTGKILKWVTSGLLMRLFLLM